MFEHHLRKRPAAGLVCLLLVVATLAGCGFQMRGNQGLTVADISSLNIRSAAARDLTREVKSQLQLSGISVSSTADYTLSLENETYMRTILSISPATGKAEEFQMTLTALVSLSRTDTGGLIRNELVTVTRDYLFDEDALLGKASEEDLIRENLRTLAAGNIIRLVSMTLNHN